MAIRRRQSGTRILEPARMTERSFFEKLAGVPLAEFTELNHEQRATAIRNAVPDLHVFFDDAEGFESRRAPARSRTLARSLFDAVLGRSQADGPATPATDASLAARIVTDGLLRTEADRDQNVYLGRLFTRTLTNAVPDLIFLPASLSEAEAAFAWASANGVPVTIRGAASTAMGGSVPNDGGLTLDVSRIDGVEPDLRDGVCVLGAGARMRTVHQKLAAVGHALPVYPSNLGATFAGWFATGGIGMNAFNRGRALDSVRSVDLVLPSGEHLRFHDDGRLDVPHDGRRSTLSEEEAAAWFRERGHDPLSLPDLAGSEGVFGLMLGMTVRIEPLPEIGAYLLAFEHRDDALAAVDWVRREAGQAFHAPANVKLLSGSHMHHVRRVWNDEATRAWKQSPARLSAGEGMPWSRIDGPGSSGVPGSPDDGHADAYLFVDFFGEDAAQAFGRRVGECPGAPVVLGDESVRFAAERFRPQQTKRLGPGLLAAEILMPSGEVPSFLPAAERLTRNAGLELDAEVYYLGDGTALVIGAYLTDHRRGSFVFDLLVAPALLDLAMSKHSGRPYVLGRWQSAWAGRKFGRDGTARLQAIKHAVDPDDLLNRGVLFGLRLRGALGALVAGTFVPAMRIARMAYGFGPAAAIGRLKRAVFGVFPGPAGGRGEPATPEAAPDVPLSAVSKPHVPAESPQLAWARALHCVNCGECNSVCPIFHESKIRLPQMLTHLGEAMHGGDTISETGSALLDLCVRCGNCEEVCQAGIPHLPLYDVMQNVSDHARGRHIRESPVYAQARERQVAILSAVRTSDSYMHGFLNVRPGRYLKRAPAALPGVARFLLLREENDAGPAETCIHCSACVAVCPTEANHEFKGDDARWITTDQHRCIGCGTCVEVCPANLDNGGRTLRVVEAPTSGWFEAIEAFERNESGGSPGTRARTGPATASPAETPAIESAPDRDAQPVMRLRETT